ncbi:MAG: DUF4915 domain-containing protein [Chthoniobacterales bacterium]|nr:DUF4915 domain-containing protein [Chthoniobacterales bacterium]
MDRHSLDLAGRTLVASGFGAETGGGLFELVDGEFHRIDALSSMGLFSTPELFFRVLYVPGQDRSGAELLVYDERGVQRYCRLDNVSQIHDIAWDGRQLIAVATDTNEVVWLNADGSRDRSWSAGRGHDAWHLNNLLLENGRIFVSAFGKFEKDRGWDAGATGHGLVIDLAARETVLTGLNCPHNPRLRNDRWLVCNSAECTLVEFNGPGTAVARRVELRGWTRGLAIAGDDIFVGESMKRGAGRSFGDRNNATVALVDYNSFEVIERYNLPCSEVYDLALVSPAVIHGIRTGFRTNPYRAQEHEEYALLRSVGSRPELCAGQRLDAKNCRIAISADVPARLAPSVSITLRCEISNNGDAVLATAPPYPVNVSYQWLRAASGECVVADGVRTPLTKAILPQGRTQCEVSVHAPEAPGDYTLLLTLVQEQVAWFHEIDPQNALRADVALITV